jgi:hypothetical protein
MIWKKKKQRLLAVFHRTWYELNIKCQKLLSKLTKTSMAITMCKHSLMYYLLLAWQEGRLPVYTIPDKFGTGLKFILFCLFTHKFVLLGLLGGLRFIQFCGSCVFTWPKQTNFRPVPNSSGTQCGKFVLRGGEIPRALSMLSIYLLLNFLNLPRALCKLSSQVRYCVNGVWESK